MSGNSSELIISPEELVRIQEACRQRAPGALPELTGELKS